MNKEVLNAVLALSKELRKQGDPIARAAIVRSLESLFAVPAPVPETSAEED